MAFLDFNQAAGAPAGSSGGARRAAAVSHEAVAGEPAFTATEWDVVHVARRDRLSSLRDPVWVERLGAFIFGKRPNPRLANSRLEALRRLAVEAWHNGYAVSPTALSTFRAAGFSAAQLETLLGAISFSRSPRKRRIFA